MKPRTARNKSSAASLSPARSVLLIFNDPGASSVCVAGSFNDWHPTDAPLARQPDGSWVKDLLLPPGRYEYLFVVDGQWRPDTAAAEQAGNPFGGYNSVLHVPG
jgi:1,4-alpha-glucan branching enzyme